MDYQELLQKYIVERQASEQKLVGGEVIELTLFASWLNKNASQQSFAPDVCQRCGGNRYIPLGDSFADCPDCANGTRR